MPGVKNNFFGNQGIMGNQPSPSGDGNSGQSVTPEDISKFLGDPQSLTDLGAAIAGKVSLPSASTAPALTEPISAFNPPPEFNLAPKSINDYVLPLGLDSLAGSETKDAAGQFLNQYSTTTSDLNSGTGVPSVGSEFAMLYFIEKFCGGNLFGSESTDKTASASTSKTGTTTPAGSTTAASTTTASNSSTTPHP